MKVVQKSQFQPVTITLETAEEVTAVWRSIIEQEVKDDGKYQNIYRELSNLFKNQVDLGGPP